MVARSHRRLFGSFVEHMGRCVYGGIFEPGHPESDADGHRLDVLELTRELGVTRGALPRRQLRVRATAGRTASARSTSGPSGSTWPGISTEPNTFGLNEFMAWAGRPASSR